ncbi:MAG: cytochrome c family protein [Sphingomonadaceae bacterium]
MDSYEFNRIAGAVLAALITVLGLAVVTGYIYKADKPEQKGFFVEGVVEEATQVAAATDEPPVEFFLASADPERGAAAFKKCTACHNLQQGGANGVGPNLYGIVGGPHAKNPSFGYSPALQERAGEPWTWAALDEWLKNPRAAIPGNRMAFAGISRAQERADILVYMNSYSDRPLPIPEAPAPTAAAEPEDASDDASAEEADETQDEAAEATGDA